VGDLRLVLHDLNLQAQPATHAAWVKRIEALRQEHPSNRIRETDKLLPQYVIKALSDAMDGRGVFVTGVGQHQMWAAQHCVLREPNLFITSGGLGTMGYEVPAAIGAQLGRPDKVVWSVAGDGGFQMTMAELATAVEARAPVKFAIINNHSLGMVRQLQDLFFEGKSHVATVYSGNPDFSKLAGAYGILGITVKDKAQVEAAIQQALAHQGPVVVDFQVEPEENVYPHIPSGASVAEMLEEPLQERAPWSR